MCRVEGDDLDICGAIGAMKVDLTACAQRHGPALAVVTQEISFEQLSILVSLVLWEIFV